MMTEKRLSARTAAHYKTEGVRHVHGRSRITRETSNTEYVHKSRAQEKVKYTLFPSFKFNIVHFLLPYTHFNRANNIELRL